MIWSELRASAYKIAAAVLGVLAVALLIACLFQWNRATRANVRADAEAARAQALQAEVSALKEAAKREDDSREATNEARAAMEQSAAETNRRLAALQGKLNDRPPVPDDCPSPDADLVRELEEGSARVRAADSRLRGLRSAKGGSAK